MKTKKKEKVLSIKAGALISALGMALMILGQFIVHHPLCPIVLIAALVLTILPLVKKRPIHDELARENDAKATKVTLLAAYCVLLVLSIMNTNGVELQRPVFLIALDSLLCLQSLSLAFFESRGSASDEEEDA